MTRSSPNALRRFAGVLLALAVVPALAFAAAQLYVQSESEAQLAQIRDEQLDGLLFSVNQNAWDVATRWAERLARIRAEGGPTGLSPDAARGFLAATAPVPMVLVSDTSFQDVAAFVRDPRWVPQVDAQMDRADFRALISPATVRTLLSQHAAGYRKLEPVELPGGRLGLVFVADEAGGQDANGPARVFCMVVEPEPFVQDVVMPKLREVASGGVELGVFQRDRPEAIAATAALTVADVERERPLWLLPAHTVGARGGEGSAEAVLRRKMLQSLFLLGGVTAVLAGGALFAWRGVRREIEVARLREDFVSNVSHELRTPLALIRMYGESLAQHRVPEDRKPRYYDTIVAETERLSRLVGNILHFSRFERGTAQLSPVPMDVSAAVAEVADRYRAVVERAGGRLEVDVADGLPEVTADRDALAEAVVNLVDNAVKYGGEGGAVEVRTHRLGDGVAIDVADRGPGLPEAERERVFAPFVRIQPESADGLVHTAKGTGLGLALVRRIAEAHGGTAVALPRDGGGSVFRLTLPTHA
ncbi:MAG: HAMP domain-containing sensor histidine kinase [Bacteroidota bacterium]